MEDHREACLTEEEWREPVQSFGLGDDFLGDDLEAGEFADGANAFGDGAGEGAYLRFFAEDADDEEGGESAEGEASEAEKRDEHYECEIHGYPLDSPWWCCHAADDGCQRGCG